MLEDKQSLPPPLSYRFDGRDFMFAALVLRGIDGTYAVLDKVNMDDYIESSGFHDLFPDGVNTLDADDSTPSAVVVIFKLTLDVHLDEYCLEPAEWIPIDPELALRCVVGGASVWSTWEPYPEQKAELDSLRAEVDRWKKLHTEAQTVGTNLVLENRRLMCDNDALRDCINKIR